MCMEHEYQINNSHVASGTFSYTTVISAYARSNAAGKAKAALDVLNHLLASYSHVNRAAKPTVVTLS